MHRLKPYIPRQDGVNPPHHHYSARQDMHHDSYIVQHVLDHEYRSKVQGTTKRSKQPFGVRRNPPPSSVLFACLPKPHRLVWLKSGLGPMTTRLRPFWWLIFTVVRNGLFSRMFHTNPSCWKGGSSSLSAPFVRPLCTPLSALEAPSCTFSTHPLCAGTPFLHRFCVGSFSAKACCKKGAKYIHQVQICLLKRTCSAFVFGPLWPCQRQAFAGPLGVITPR